MQQTCFGAPHGCPMRPSNAPMNALEGLPFLGLLLSIVLLPGLAPQFWLQLAILRLAAGLVSRQSDSTASV